MAEQRCKQAAVGLSGGEILILGRDGPDSLERGTSRLIERFDPERGNFIEDPRT